MGLPLAALALPAIGAAMGGYEGYKRGGLGGAVLGAGTGALVPQGLRMAGAALGGTALGAKIAPGVYKGAKALGLGGPSSLIGAAAQQRAGQAILPGAVAALGMGLGAPALAGRLAGGVAAPLGQGAGNLAQTGAGLVGYGAPGAPQYGGQPYDPNIGPMGGVTPQGLPLDVLGAPGMGRRLEQYKTAETMRDAMRLLNPEVYAATEATKKQDFARQAAMKGIAQNIATRAAMLQNAQLAGINAGQQALTDAGRALTSQYQYQ